MASLENIKLILDIDDNSKDGLLELYINRAELYVESYLKTDEIPKALSSVVEDIAILNYRNRGVENVSSESKGSLSETYTSGLPGSIIKQLDEHARVVRVV